MRFSRSAAFPVAGLLLLSLASALSPIPSSAQAAALPDNRGWEMVSPIDKNGGAVQGFGQNHGGGVLQAASNGNAVTYSSSASFGVAQGAPPASQYLSRREAGGWATENITVPTLSGSYGDEPNGVPYQLFSTDLARGLLLDGRRCEEAEPCPRSYSLRNDESGALTPLPEAAAGMRVLSATPDLGQIVFESEGSFYEWSGEGLVPIAPPPPSPGVLGTSADGSVIYYRTEAGLFVSREGASTEIAPGAEAAQPSDYPPATATARVSPDGTHLAFLSKTSLTAYDNTDRQTGEPDTELYLYEAASGGGGTLTCASCNPTGARPLGPSTIPGAISNGTGPTATQAYKPRDLSTDGTRLFFDSADSLVLGDTDAAPDVYEWEAQGTGSCQKPGGCIGLISSGRSSEGSSFVDASASGSDAFFLTGASLVPSDPGSFDLYDAREAGGFPVPPNPIECDGDACQPLPSAPEDPTPGTLLPRAGNPPVHFPKTGCPKGTHRTVRRGKSRCVAKRHHPHKRRGHR